MLVRDYMTRHPIMVEPTTSLVDVQRIMGENNVRHIPVVGDGKRLLGLVTQRTLLVEPSRLASLNVWEITRFLSGLKAKDIMIKARDVISVVPDSTIEDAAHLMADKKVGCVPVLEDGVVVGILTERDLLRHLANMLVTGMRTVRVTVRMPDVKGELGKLVAAISAQGWGILACGGVPAVKEPGKWDAVVKIRDVPRDEIVQVLSQIPGQEIIDVRETE